MAVPKASRSISQLEVGFESATESEDCDPSMVVTTASMEDKKNQGTPLPARLAFAISLIAVSSAYRL